MEKLEILQRIINNNKNNIERKRCIYLEIGVFSGSNFLPIQASQKIAVDPKIKISIGRKIKWMLKNPCNIRSKYYEITSDVYFNNIGENQLDVIFIDGLHTYEQSLKDVINALDVLSAGGCVIMHDCLPPHVAAACPADSLEQAAALKLPGWTHEWCGDVWKTICYLRSFRRDLNVFVLRCDYGLGIITKGKPDNLLDLSENDIKNMTFDDLSEKTEKLLNLKHEEFINHFLASMI